MYVGNISSIILFILQFITFFFTLICFIPLSRFIPEQRKNLVWINERSHEAYAKNYEIFFPHDEHLSGRNLKTDPFHNVSYALRKYSNFVNIFQLDYSFSYFFYLSIMCYCSSFMHDSYSSMKAPSWKNGKDGNVQDGSC